MLRLDTDSAPLIPVDVGLDPDDPASAYRLLAAGRREGIAGALLTITGIEGGAPRALGTHMAVLADGRFCGYVSGGCVEAAVAAEAVAVMARGRDEVLRFGRNSPFFDIRLPCGGGIDVHVHPRPAAELVDGAIARLADRQPFDVLLEPGPGRSSLVQPGEPGEGFRRQYRPATRLVLIGQGNELAVTTHIARAAGLEVFAYATGNGAMAAAARLGVEVIEASGAEAVGELPIDAWTAIVCLFHDHGSEARFLVAALASDAFYIGALGSRRTHAERVMRLLDTGLAQAKIDRIHAPIGLIERTREAGPLAFSVLADVTRERMRLDN
jgi:xanthine dehydrogenase accessory factor